MGAAATADGGVGKSIACRCFLLTSFQTLIACRCPLLISPPSRQLSSALLSPLCRDLFLRLSVFLCLMAARRAVRLGEERTRDTAEESGPEVARAPPAGTAGSGRRCPPRATSSSSSRSPASTGAPRARAAKGGARPPRRPRRTPFGNRHANVPRSVGNFWISAYLNKPGLRRARV